MNSELHRTYLIKTIDTKWLDSYAVHPSMRNICRLLIIIVELRRRYKWHVERLLVTIDPIIEHNLVHCMYTCTRHIRLLMKKKKKKNISPNPYNYIWFRNFLFSFPHQDIDELIYRLEELKQQNHYGNFYFFLEFSKHINYSRKHTRTHT